MNETSVKKNIYDMSNEKYKTLENINDFLIVSIIIIYLWLIIDSENVIFFCKILIGIP